MKKKSFRVLHLVLWLIRGDHCIESRAGAPLGEHVVDGSGEPRDRSDVDQETLFQIFSGEVADNMAMACRPEGFGEGRADRRMSTFFYFRNHRPCQRSVGSDPKSLKAFHFRR